MALIYPIERLIELLLPLKLMINFSCSTTKAYLMEEENIEIVKREMSDARINIHNFIKNNLLLIHQIPSSNLACIP